MSADESIRDAEERQLWRETFLKGYEQRSFAHARVLAENAVELFRKRFPRVTVIPKKPPKQRPAFKEGDGVVALRGCNSFGGDEIPPGTRGNVTDTDGAEEFNISVRFAGIPCERWVRQQHLMLASDAPPPPAAPVTSPAFKAGDEVIALPGCKGFRGEEIPPGTCGKVACTDNTDNFNVVVWFKDIPQGSLVDAKFLRLADKLPTPPAPPNAKAIAERKAEIWRCRQRFVAASDPQIYLSELSRLILSAIAEAQPKPPEFDEKIANEIVDSIWDELELEREKSVDRPVEALRRYHAALFPKPEAKP